MICRAGSGSMVCAESAADGAEAPSTDSCRIFPIRLSSPLPSLLLRANPRRLLESPSADTLMLYEVTFPHSTVIWLRPVPVWDKRKNKRVGALSKKGKLIARIIILAIIITALAIMGCLKEDTNDEDDEDEEDDEEGEEPGPGNRSPLPHWLDRSLVNRTLQVWRQNR